MQPLDGYSGPNEVDIEQHEPAQSLDPWELLRELHTALASIGPLAFLETSRLALAVRAAFEALKQHDAERSRK